MFEIYKNTMQSFMADYEYPAEAQTEIVNAFSSAFADKTAFENMQNYLSAYEQDCEKGVLEMQALCRVRAEKTQINVYPVYMSTLILLAEIAKKHYAEKGVSEDMWKKNFTDFRYKLYECKLVKGVWGNFVPDWNIRFFNVSRFTFGKLQFEIEKFGRTYDKNGVSLCAESKVINVHIPRTGKRLSPKDVDEACENAAAFFKEKYGIEQTVFVCHSWLLYPENKKMLQETSNLYSFISRFDIVDWEEYKDYKEVWRLFDTEYNPDLTKMPADTSLRRAYIERMQKGEKTGCGYGVFVYKK